MLTLPAVLGLGRDAVELAGREWHAFQQRRVKQAQVLSSDRAWRALSRPPAVLYPRPLGRRLRRGSPPNLGSADQVRFRRLAHELRVIIALASR
ncbi:MAG TPA: hypothetical protein VGM07_14210 [Stellaceae bacterium]